MSVNTIILSGRLGKDPELRSTSGGKSVAGFTLAVDEGYGEHKKTLWFYCEVWGKTAEAVARLVTKGKRVVVTGRLSEDQWTDKQSGQARSKPKIVAGEVEIIDFPEKDQADGHGEVSDEDIPF